MKTVYAIMRLQKPEKNLIREYLIEYKSSNFHGISVQLSFLLLLFLIACAPIAKQVTPSTLQNQSESVDYTGHYFPLPAGREFFVCGWKSNSGNHVGKQLYATDFNQKGPDQVACPIVAAKGGRVVAVQKNMTQCCDYEKSNYPNAHYVIIDIGGGYESEYLHLNEVYVDVGDEVVTGQEIGTLGNTGWTNGGNHLHYQVQIAQGSPFGQSVNMGFEELGGRIPDTQNCEEYEYISQNALDPEMRRQFEEQRAAQRLEEKAQWDRLIARGRAQSMPECGDAYRLAVEKCEAIASETPAYANINTCLPSGQTLAVCGYPDRSSIERFALICSGECVSANPGNADYCDGELEVNRVCINNTVSPGQPAAMQPAIVEPDADVTENLLSLCPSYSITEKCNPERTGGIASCSNLDGIGVWNRQATRVLAACNDSPPRWIICAENCEGAPEGQHDHCEQYRRAFTCP